jgi:hypothetical protein
MQKWPQLLARSALIGFVLIGVAAFSLARSTSSARADTRTRGIGFDASVFVDQNLGGGEPSVIYDPRIHDYIYTAHEGTTLSDHDGVGGSPDTSLNWLENYRNQVNVWTSPGGNDWTRVSFAGTGFTSNPITNQGFSDPDLTFDQGGRLYNTGIDLANDALFSSTDGGKSWPRGTINCHDGDRPWLAGGRPNDVFLATDTVEGTLSHQIFRSTNGAASCGSTGVPDAGTISKTSRLDAGDSYTGYGKLRYDAHGSLNGALVEPIIVSGKNGAAGVGVSVLKDADRAFNTGTGSFVPHVASLTQGLLDNMPSIDLDSAGDIFLTWSDNPTAGGNPTGLNHVYLDMSRDGGQTWLRHPIVVAQAHNTHAPHTGTVLWPWLAAGSRGNVSVVWYQYDQVVPDPDQATCSCNVSVMDANMFGVGTRKMHQHRIDAVGRPIHTGGICQSGTTCVATGQDRRLGDYFTNNLDGRGCVMIATGDTTKLDPITGQIRAWSLPLFLRQNAGASLTTGRPCGQTAQAHHHHHHHRSHHRGGSHHPEGSAG